MKKLFPYLIVGALFCAVAASQAITVTFEDLAGTGPVPNNYAGLTWTNWVHYDQPLPPFNAGSGQVRLFQNNSAIVPSIQFGHDITFISAWLAGQSFEQYLEGYHNGVKIFESTHTANDGSAFGQYFTLNWDGVDEIRLQAGSPDQCAFDDVQYDIPDTDGDGVPDFRDNCPTTPNPEKIAFLSDRDGNYEIYAMNPDGSDLTNLTNNAANDFEPSFSPGNKIAFRSFRDGNSEIYVMKPDGSNPTRLTTNAFDDEEPSLNASGDKIAFASDRDGNEEIYLMNADGTNQVRLTNNAALDLEPAFNPAGSKVAFLSDRDGDYEIYVMNLDGSNQTNLTTDAAFDIEPSFSPDGSKIAFASNRDGNFEIYLMNADGSNLARLTNNGFDDEQPSFSPDGSKIAFTSFRTGSFDIYVMNADGSNQTSLITDQAADFQPSWGRQADGDGDGIGDACDPNTEPTITAASGVTTGQDAGVSNMSIATVNDAEDEEAALSVMVNGSTSATINGVTISNLAVDSSGNVTADLSATCTATDAAFTLRVTDSGSLFAEAALNVAVMAESTPPAITLLGADPLTVECHTTFTDPGATASDNCAGDLTGAIVTTGNVDPNAPGTYILSYNVQDPSGNSGATVTRTVNVADSTPPVITSVAASPKVLKKPNHGLRLVTVSVSATDPCDPQPVSRIISVTSNEPDSGTGPDDRPNDIQITGNLTVKLRAENSPTGSGRIYTITVQCQDASGNASTARKTVRVKK